ncbi:MAG: ankyrin repeat domain-containing protein [Akkermansia sp.]|nr:ankyrin repeat domain-containing protein [Akkermansia sp.]
MRAIMDTTTPMGNITEINNNHTPIQTMLEQFITAKHADDYHPNYLHFLISKGAILTAATAQGKPYIVLAAEHHRWELVNHILDLGENADFPGTHPEKQTLLHILATQAHQDACFSGLMNRIFRQNPFTNPNVVNAHGFSPLHLACMHGNHEMVRELLLHGANPNALTPINQNALHLCAKYSANHFHHLLLRCGANPWQEDVYGNIPLVQTLLHGNNFPALQMLLTGHQLPQKYHTRILFAAVHCLHEDRLWTLLQRAGLIINPNAEFDGTPLLHHAIRCHNFYLVNKLIRSGAFIHSTDAEGNTPWLTAIKYEKSQALPLLRLLVDAGANPHGFNHLGMNAWDILALSSNDDAHAFQIAKFLFHTGVSLRQESHESLIRACLRLKNTTQNTHTLFFLHEHFRLHLSPELEKELLLALPSTATAEEKIAAQWPAQFAKEKSIVPTIKKTNLLSNINMYIKQFLSSPKLAKLANQLSLF